MMFPVLVALAGRVVPEVVRLVDDDEVVVAPVQGREIDVAGVTGLAAEVGVGNDIVAEAVGDEGIEEAVGLVNGPVVAELLRAENEDALVLQLEVFHDGERLVGFPQANAVRDDAAVVAEDFVDGAFGPVLLELEQRFPDFGLEQAGLAQVRVGLAGVAEELLEEVEERLVVDELRGVVLVELLEVVEDVLLHVLHESVVAPKLVEPLLEFLTVAVAVHDEVQLDVVAGMAEAETAHREVGTAENGVLHASGGDVIHLAVQEVGLLDGPDLHLALDPVGALPGDAFLLKFIGEFQAVGVDDERFFLGLAGVETVDEGRLAEEKIEMFDALECLLERVVGVDGEVGRYDGELGATLGFRPQEVGDRSPGVVVAQAGVIIWRGHCVSPERGPCRGSRGHWRG